MTRLTLLTLIILASFANTTLLGQQKSISEWKPWDNQLTIQQLLTESIQQSILGLTDKDQLQILSQYTDARGIYHVRAQQVYNGVPVIGAQILFHEHPDKGTAHNGLLIKELEINTTPTIDEADALNTTLQYLKANKYAWQNQKEEQLLQEMTNNPAATYLPKGELVIVGLTLHNHPAAYRLAYRFDMYSLDPLGRYDVYIDAHSGQFIKKINKLHDIHEDEKELNPPLTVNLPTRFYNNKDLTISYSSNGTGGTNYTMENDACRLFNGHSQVLFTNTNNIWQDTTANTAYWCVEETYNYFKNTHNYTGHANDSIPMNVIVHWGNQLSNAFWNGQYMVLGDGDTIPYVSADIVAHEWVHGLIEKTAQLTYEGESGAINESICDIFGIVMKDAIATNDWKIGSEVGGIRDFANPNSRHHPDTYLGTHWYAGINPSKTVHTNSGVMNYWFYLLVQGGSGTNDLGYNYNVNGIGMADAAKIVFKALTDYLIPNAQYLDVRMATLQAAANEFSIGSLEYQAVLDAWCAVGIGGADASFTFTNSLGSLAVTFIPQILDNSLNYSWNFGDGNTSTLDSLTHSYQTEGIYSVKLIVNDNCGFSDTSEQVIVVTQNTDALAKDSLMLVKLFNDTKGSTDWKIDKKWDLTQPVKTWSGITLEGDTVVKIINLSFHGLSGKFSNLYFPNLQELDLAVNSITKIENIYFPKLKLGGATENSIDTVINMNCPNLESFSIQYNQIVEIKNLYFPKITQFYLSYNKLSKFPELGLSTLNQLWLEVNEIDSLKSINSYPNLNLLNLSGNGLTHLAHLNHLSLISFHVFNNKLDFGDLERNIGIGTDFLYRGQDSVITNNEGNFLYVKSGGKTSNNIYKWYRNGNLIETILGDSLYLATLPGYYHCVISNNLVTTSSYDQNLHIKSKVYFFSDCITGDSISLVKLINNTNAQNWTNQWNTLNEITTWQGVYLNPSGCGIDRLDIRNQNAQDTIPNLALYRLKKLQADSNAITGLANFQYLDSLNYLSLDSNQLESLPNLSSFPMLDTLYVQNNKLVFSDLLHYYYANLNDFKYANQDSFELQQLENQLIADVGDAANNTLEWYYNGQLLTTSSGNNKLTITNTGHYQVKVTNSVLGLTLWSNTFQVSHFCDADFSYIATPICEGMSIIFNNQTVNTTGTTYDWQVNKISVNSTPTLNYVFDSAGLYEVKLINTLGNCTAEYSDTVVIYPSSSNDLAPMDESVCASPFSKTLTARAGMTSYEWKKGTLPLSSTISCTATEHTTYTVTATDMCNIGNSATTDLYIGNDCYVWAGDCNNDGIVDGEDWLIWGLMFGDTGTVRQNADTAWQAQLCENWGTYTNGINSKHGDTNGDGVVNFADTVAISAHFGKTNPYYLPDDFDWDYSPWKVKTRIIDFKKLPNGKVEVTLGLYIKDKTYKNRVLDLHGFNVNVDVHSPLLQYFGGDANFSSSFLGTENSNIYALRNNRVNENRYQVSCTRTDRQNRRASGLAGKLSIIIAEPVSTGDTVKLKFFTGNAHGSVGRGQTHALRSGFSSLTYLADGTGFNSNGIMVEITGSPSSCSEAGTLTAMPLEYLSPPYSYLWSTGDTSQTISGLDTGEYTVVITDALGNKGFGIGDVTGRNQMTVAPIITSASQGQANGAVALNIQGGSGYYSFLWENDDTVSQRSNLSSGNYMVTVTDDTLGCVVIQGITIGEESVPLQLKVFLEGAYDGTVSGGQMHDSLNTNGLLPLDEPFTALGFERPDTAREMVTANVLQQNDIVDWVLVELRDKDYSSLVVKTRAALLKTDGTIVDLDGQSSLSFNNLIHQSYYISIQHRNHLSIMTATAYHLDENGLTVDFSSPSTPTYGTNGQKTINGILVMYSGDSDLDGTINSNDNTTWQLENGQPFKYYETLSDFNLDGQINAVDINLFWKPNQSKETQTPK